MESDSKAQETRLVVTELYGQAIMEYPEYLKFPQEDITKLISNTINKITDLEDIGKEDANGIETDINILKNIGAVWIFSGPGTYDNPTKDDKYNKFEWAKGMDRKRLNHGALLARKITEAKCGQHLSGSMVEINQRKQQTKQMIRYYGPKIIYNGTQLENDTVINVLSREGVVIPRENVNTIYGNIKTTLDQVKTFKLPVKLNTNEELAIVSHAPHLVRIMHMVNKYKPFPGGTKVRLFPIPTIESGKNEYMYMEILGLLRYVYLDKKSTYEGYPYKLSH